MQPSVNIIELRINLLPFDTKSKKSVFYYFAHWLHRTYSIFLLQLFICLREVAHVIEIVSLLSYFEKIAYMSVVLAYVSLWLSAFGYVSQGQIRLKVL